MNKKEIRSHIQSQIGEREKYEYRNTNSVATQYITTEIKNYFESIGGYTIADAETVHLSVKSRYYRKQLSDGTWMCARISNHDPDLLRTYVQYTSDKIPSSKEHSNISFVFYGMNEKSLKWAIKTDDDNIAKIAVYQDIIERFHDFVYTTLYYTPGLILNEDINPLCKAIETWFSGNGDIEYENPLPNRIYDRDSNNSKAKTPKLKEYNPLIYSEKALIKFVRRNDNTNESMVEIHGGEKESYVLADVTIKERKTGKVVGRGELIYEIIGQRVYIPKSTVHQEENIEDLLNNPDEFAKRLKEKQDKTFNDSFK